MVGKILIVDNVATNRIVFKAALGEAFYQPVFAVDGENCLRLARETMPDLVLLDLTLPDQSGIVVINRLRADPAMQGVPVLALAQADQADLRLDALLAGADDVLAKPVDLQSLLARVRNLLRNREGIRSLTTGATQSEIFSLAEAPALFERQSVISVISAHAETARNLQASLGLYLADRITIQSREDAFVEAHSGSGHAVPDVFIVDAGIAGNGGGLRLMSELRSRYPTQHSAICIVRPKASTDSAAMAYDLGADDVVDADTPAREIAARLRAIIRRKRSADAVRATVQDGLRLAVIDPLTGLHNRRYALPQLAAIAERAAAGGTVFAVMVIDLDKFKSVNDRLGHAAGDAVLAEVARRLQVNLRTDDLLARIGGEEFLVALPDTNFADACSAADRLCHAIEEHPISVGFAASVRVTVSIGLAVSSQDATAEPATHIVNRADRALLSAKAEGRNKVTISKDAA